MLVALIAEITDDLGALEKLADRLQVARTSLPDPPDPTRVMAIAAYLHHVYTGMESIFERIARTIDRRSPSGDRWHSELLLSMGVELEGVRPAVLGEVTRAHLSRLLRFRHFFRHAYRIDLLWIEVAPLVADIDAIMNMHHRDLRAFLAHLHATGAS